MSDSQENNKSNIVVNSSRENRADDDESDAKIAEFESERFAYFSTMRRNLESRTRSPRNSVDSVGMLEAIFVDEIPIHLDEMEALQATDFQRLVITNSDVAVSTETKNVCNSLLHIAKLRDKYIDPTYQPYWGGLDQKKFANVFMKKKAEYERNNAQARFRRRLDPVYIPFPENKEEDTWTDRTYSFGPAEFRVEFIKGVGTVIDTQKNNKPLDSPPSVQEYYDDLFALTGVTHDAASKSFCFQRLKLLESLFNLHVLLNSEKENKIAKAVPHRDFYNVRKVDTHIHHSAIMNQKHLLRFIKSKLKHCANEVVIERYGKFLTLSEVFTSLNLTAYDLSVDTLDMHADNTFHRFDRFNLKYNPIGESRLREVFLKVDNMLDGRYIAEVTKEVISDLEANKYVSVEPRVSIYGRKLTEWSDLAKWFYVNRLASRNVRWMIQIPRIYESFKQSGSVNTFQDMLDNIFKPLFDVTLNPQSNPYLDNFLNQVTGFDCVDDESKLESLRFSEYPIPEKWNLPENPPYSYWIYYIYANLYNLNRLRKRFGLSTFAFRPHAGEAGDVNHLAATYLCADHINHGILLRKAPVLQYLYYLKQIGLAVSPLSNNKLFLDYHANPFPLFFARGLNVSLSTDDPLMLHITKEPLVEEYSVASQVWKLSSTDVCEIARNSVLQSGFEYPYKVHFLGQGFDKRTAPNYGNNIAYTNIPDVRVIYRQERLQQEWDFLRTSAT